LRSHNNGIFRISDQKDGKRAIGAVSAASIDEGIIS
jgi:hypothetical protein